MKLHAENRNSFMSSMTSQRTTTARFRERWLALQLRGGALIGYPTETVFGIGCDARNAEAVAAIAQMKTRARGKGLILVAARPELLRDWVTCTPAQWRTACASWPGPVTWVFPAGHPDGRALPTALLAGDGTVAVRVSPHAQVQRLSEALQGPLVSTSANRRGRPPARNVWVLRQNLGRALDFVLGGAPGSGQPSRVMDGRTGRVLRH
jgi:L-threonylcarbamoyladenylate synthase